MKIKQLSLFIENKTGAINSPCKILADAGISISTLSLADTKNYGILRLLVKDWEKALKLLEENQIAAKTTEVVAIEVDHKPGSLSRILAVLDENAVDVEYMYAFAPGFNGKAALIFRFADADAALAKLQHAEGIRIVDGSALFGSENN